MDQWHTCSAAVCSVPCLAGKAGGFLALDWNDSSPPLGALARTSYALHAQLAEQLQADVGYRTVHTLQARDMHGYM